MVDSVSVRTMSLSWLKRNDTNFLDLVEILNETKNKAIFPTQFVSIIIDTFWEEYSKKIQWQYFAPFLLYHTCMISFMVYAL